MKTNIKFSIAFALALFTLKVDAQVKVGSNPNTTNSTANLQVEASDGTQSIFLKSNGNAGVGTLTPSNRLHVFAPTNPLRIEGVQASASVNDKALVIDASGVVKTALVSQSCFAGYLNTDFSTGVIAPNKVIVQTELIDLGNEYNTATGLFTPAVSGVYSFDITVTVETSDVNGTVSGLSDNRQVVGFVDNATGKWIVRFNFETTLDARSYTFKGVASLTAGQSYHFGIAPTASIPTTLKIVANPTGITGTGIGTYFSIARLK